MIKEISSGPPSSTSNYDFYNQKPLINNGILYFASNDGTDGQELWQTTGTAAGTSLLSDTNPGGGSSLPVPLAVVNGQILLFADDGAHGQELMSVSSRVAPVIGGIASQTIIQGQAVSLNIGALGSDASVPQPAALTYSLAAGAPAGASINPATGVFTWATSTSVPVGSYSITVVASDGNASPMTGSQTFSVNVLYGGPAPTVVSTGLSTRRGLTITLDFSQVLATGPAENPANYELVIPPKTRRGKSRVIALTPHFTPGSATVTLTAHVALGFSPRRSSRSWVRHRAGSQIRTVRFLTTAPARRRGQASWHS